jgi:hypothetical protein
MAWHETTASYVVQVVSIQIWYLQGYENSRARQFTFNDDIVTVQAALVFSLYSVQLVISHLYCFTGHCLLTVTLNNNQKSLKMILSKLYLHALLTP